MTRERDSMVLAVDGGGTRCRLALDWGEDRVLVEVGPANVSSDFEAAITEITEGLTKLASDSNLGLETLFNLPAHLALAGVTGRDLARKVAYGLPLAQIDVHDDRLAALQGAHGTSDGAIAHCGTGSFFALRLDGHVRLSGGWGPRLGDEASAQWIGMRALARSLDASDNLVPDTPLTRALRAAFDTPAAIVSFAASATPAQIGEFAQSVTEHAKHGDATALEILKSGADEITTRLRAMGWTPDLPLCLTGGIGQLYQTHLPVDVASAVVTPAGKPIDGAVALARQFGKELAA